MTEYQIRSHTGRPIIILTDEKRAREVLAARRRQVPTLRMFKVERQEQEIAA